MDTHWRPEPTVADLRAGISFRVMDIGGHELFLAHSKHDADIRRPMPLQILAADESGLYRLYSGRNFVTFRVAAKN